METAITEVTSIRLQNDTEKATWKTRRYFVDFKSRIYVGTSTSIESMSLFPCRFTFQIWWNLERWNFDVESMANPQRCVHWNEKDNPHYNGIKYHSETTLLQLCSKFFLNNYEALWQRHLKDTLQLKILGEWVNIGANFFMSRYV